MGEAKVILIDGNSIMFRAYYATAYTGNLMQTKDGIYTNALFAFINMVHKIQQNFDYSHILVAFDKGKQTFRHLAYPEYKGTRKEKLEEEFLMQIPYIKEFLDVINVKRLEQYDLEADDIISIYTQKAKQANKEVVVISGDKDLLQLVDEQTEVHLTKKGVSELEVYTQDNFKEKMGFMPQQLIDYKGLIGDNSDNLPGVRGVGPKTAVSLLSKYHDLDGVFANIASEKGKLQENLVADKDIALRTRYLATLLKTGDVPYTIADLTKAEFEQQKLRAFYERFDFQFFISRLDSSVEKTPTFTLPSNQVIGDLTKVASELHQDCFLEVELTGENYHRQKLLGLSFYFPTGMYYLSADLLTDERIKKYLSDSNYAKKVWDSKKVICSLADIGISIANITFDMTLANYLLAPDNANVDYHSILTGYIANDLPYLTDIYGKKAEYTILEEAVYVKYSFQKCYFLAKAEPVVLAELQKAQMNELYQEMELPLARVLADMEQAGCAIDQKRLNEIGVEFASKISELTEQIYQLAGKAFNIGSPKQLGQVLFEELGLWRGKKNKTGYSTAADVLENLVGVHPIIALVLEYRKYTKLLNTYVTGLSAEIFPDGKVHTIFKQTLTSTGRLSSVAPNIQNIPIRKEEGRIIRTVFVPSHADGLIISADYSQIELRLLAEMANCQAMINDFNLGLDMHRSTAAKVYGVAYDDVTKEMRSSSKAINFGIVYGMSDWGLSEALKISPAEASDFIKRYFAIYPEIKTYLDEIVQKAKEVGYSETLFGRRRPMKDINSSNQTLRHFQERTAMNAPIQGTAADIMKLAMVKIAKGLNAAQLQSKMIAQIHDEVIIDAVSGEEGAIRHIIQDAMEHAANLKVKLTIEIASGTSWDIK